MIVFEIYAILKRSVRATLEINTLQSNTRKFKLQLLRVHRGATPSFNVGRTYLYAGRRDPSNAPMKGIL